MSRMASSPPLSLGRVAVVDDDKVQRERVAALLRAEGYTVHALEGAGRVLEMHQRKELDLVLLDVVLEGLSGIECCRLLKATGVFLPIVLVIGVLIVAAAVVRVWQQEREPRPPRRWVPVSGSLVVAALTTAGSGLSQALGLIWGLLALLLIVVVLFFMGVDSI